MNPTLEAYNCSGNITIQEILAYNRPAVLEPKYDGFRLICHVQDGYVDMWTRAMKSQNGKLPHIEAELLATFPAGTVVDGEIMALRRNADGTVENRFEDVQSIMLSKPALAVAKGAHIKLDYVIFDMTYDAGADIRQLSLTTRTSQLQFHLDANPNRTHVDITPRFDVSQETHDILVNMGFEGSVVKLTDTAYQNGKRGKGWYKIKNQPEVDAVIVGFMDGRGKFAGQVGAIIFGQPVDSCPVEIRQALVGKKDACVRVNGVDYVVRGQCSGMDDSERLEVSNDRHGFLGTVITVKHMGLMHGDSPKMRHPQFDRFREDKPANEVIWHNG